MTLTTYPGPSAGMEYLIANVSKARAVLDTRVFFNIDEDDSNISAHRKERSKRFDESRKAALRHGAMWKDLYSENRLIDLENHISWLSGKMNNVTYALRVLPESHPIINFIVIDYMNGRSEVLFGWGYHTFDLQGSVFLSDNENIVNYFRRYYELLWQIGEKYKIINSD